MGDIVRKVKFLLKGCFCLIILFIIFNLGMFLYCYITPKIDIYKSQSYYLYDSDSNLVFNNNDDWVALSKISPYLVEATINTEDKRFFKHFGIDYIRVAKAVLVNLKSFSMKEGASTITQQYARNLFLNFDKTWSRKMEEALLAFEIETHYSKEQILEGYLNTIDYGGIYGIENASYYYFGKSSEFLNLAESALLCGIPKSPYYYSPLVNFDRAKERQELILKMMLNNEVITKEEYEEAINYELVFEKADDKKSLAGLMYFKDAVINELYNISGIPKSVIDTGGLKVYTTLDIKGQTQLETAISNNMKENTDFQVAGILMQPDNGAVLALVGGVNYNESQFNRAINAKRQVGSTMKPFLYYAALENGFTASSSFISEKTIFTFSGDKTYAPKNYNDRYPNKPISMGAAIAYSDNIYAVKTHLFLGEEVLVDTAKRVGISSNLSAIPSLALGSEEISLIDMVRGYATFANEGYKIKPHFITKVTDSKGVVLYEFNEVKESVLNKSITFILNNLLTSTYDTGFIDYNSPTLVNLLPEMTHKYAVKTGSSGSDYWIIGYNKNAVLGVWSGYDDNREVNFDVYNEHKNIWIQTMEGYLVDKDKKTEWYNIPSNVVGVLVNPITGEVANENSKNSRIFYYIKGTEPYYDMADLDLVFKEDNKKKE